MLLLSNSCCFYINSPFQCCSDTFSLCSCSWATSSWDVRGGNIFIKSQSFSCSEVQIRQETLDSFPFLPLPDITFPSLKFTCSQLWTLWGICYLRHKVVLMYLRLEFVKSLLLSNYVTVRDLFSLSLPLRLVILKMGIMTHSCWIIMKIKSQFSPYKQNDFKSCLSFYICKM